MNDRATGNCWGKAGVMTLVDGTRMNYGAIRITDMEDFVFYTGKGLREMFKPDMTEEDQMRAEKLKQLDEQALMKSGHIGRIPFSEIKEIN